MTSLCVCVSVCYQVTPCKEQFVAVIFDGCCASMKSFMHQCHEAMMVDGHHWRQQAGESKLKFKVRPARASSRSNCYYAFCSEVILLHLRALYVCCWSTGDHRGIVQSQSEAGRQAIPERHQPTASSVRIDGASVAQHQDVLQRRARRLG